jgi:hypothetical protein
MTIQEIDEKHDGEWVYITNTKEGEYGEVIGGEIAAHSENREKVVQEMLECSDDSVYIKYAGKIPEGVSVLL